MIFIIYIYHHLCWSLYIYTLLYFVNVFYRTFDSHVFKPLNSVHSEPSSNTAIFFQSYFVKNIFLNIYLQIKYYLLFNKHFWRDFDFVISTLFITCLFFLFLIFTNILYFLTNFKFGFRNNRYYIKTYLYIITSR